MSAPTPTSLNQLELITKALEAVRDERAARIAGFTHGNERLDALENALSLELSEKGELFRKCERLAKENAQVASNYLRLKEKAMALIKERDTHIVELRAKLDETRAQLEATRTEREIQVVNYEQRTKRLEAELVESRAQCRQIATNLSRYEKEATRLQQLNESLLDTFKVEAPAEAEPDKDAALASNRFLVDVGLNISN